MDYFSSDWHLGHKNIIKLAKRPFATIEEMNETIITNMIAPLKKGDTLYFLGDLAFKEYSAIEFFKRLPKGVTFIWVTGNHDKKIRQARPEIAQITPMKEMKIGNNFVTLCHYPMRVWNHSHHNSWNLFGHLHTNENNRVFETVGKMLNVNCEYHDYKPWSATEVIEYMANQQNNYDFVG